MRSEKSKSSLKDKKALFVLGVGLGYQVRALKQRVGPDTKIYAIERYEDVFRKAIETQHWDGPEMDGVEFWIGEDVEDVLAHLDLVTSEMASEEWDIVTNRPSIRLDPEYYKRVIRERGANE